VIWAIGLSMIALAGLLWLPRPALLVLAIAVVAGHNLFDGCGARQRPAGGAVESAAPARLDRGRRAAPAHLLPGAAVDRGDCAGLSDGALVRPRAPAQRQRWLLWAGVGALALFALLRFANQYGDALAYQTTRCARG
jgi:uncharacterized membrane protein